MDINYLPNEILVKIFDYLRASDILFACLVCKKWREAAQVVLIEKVAVVITEGTTKCSNTLLDSYVNYKYWKLKDLDIKYRGPFELLWRKYAEHIKSLCLSCTEISERDILSILKSCLNLQFLCLEKFSHIFMTGTFLENADDLNALKSSLKNVSKLDLICSRYMTDSIFCRLSSVVGELSNLNLFGSQISYQNSIYKRFYPSDGRVEASEHVLTFNCILKFIEQNKLTLKRLNLGDTSIDNESLHHLGALPGLVLESLHLSECPQFNSNGVQLLIKNQNALTELDFSLSPRVTDVAIVALADHLPRLKILRIKRCLGVTAVGLEHVRRLRALEELDISHLDVQRWESVDAALVTEARPAMVSLRVASLPLQWQTVVAVADGMPNLRHLDLSMCYNGVTDKSIQAICKSLVKLEFLDLMGDFAVSDIGLSGHGLANRPEDTTDANELSLENLGIRSRNAYHVSLGSKAEQQIRQEGEVKRYLKENAEQIVSSSEFGLSHLQNLRHLNLCGCLKVSDISLIYAIHFQELTYLNLSCCPQINEEGLLAVCVKCPSVEHLILRMCSNITDRSVLVIAHRLRRIRTLDFQRCSNLTDDALDSLSNCRGLTSLDVSGCFRMTTEGVQILRGRLPSLVDFKHSPLEFSEGGGGIEVKKAPTPPPLLAKLVNKILMR